MSTALRHSLEDLSSSQRSTRNVNEGESNNLCNFIRRDNTGESSGCITVEQLCDMQESNLLVAFLPETRKINTTLYAKLSDRFKIPTLFWTSVAQDASGFFGCQGIQDSNGVMDSFSSHLRFLIKDIDKISQPLPDYLVIPYIWHKLAFYTTWTSKNSLVVLCFGIPDVIRVLLSDLAQLRLDDPFSFHTILIEHVITLYDTALWTWRNVVRHREQNRPKKQKPEPDYSRMHEIGRHVIHFSETLLMAKETLSTLLQEYEFFLEENRPRSIQSTFVSSQNKRVFRSQKTLLTCLYLRSEALRNRLQNEISLAFHIGAIQDTVIALQLQRTSEGHSVAMKSVAVLGLVFLPGTYICSLFSTSFFDYSPDRAVGPHWAISDKFWVYWIIAIPITVVTGVLWYQYQSTIPLVLEEGKREEMQQAIW